MSTLYKTINRHFNFNQSQILAGTVIFYREFIQQNLQIITHKMFFLARRQSLSYVKVITFNEATEAIHSFSHDKSPGSDGLTCEFYVQFWATIGPDLINVFNYAVRNGLLSRSQRTGVIILLYEKGKKELLKKNWRPITFLNIDYKVLTKCLAHRLRKVMPAVVNCDQTCSVKGRSIFETTSLIRDTIDYINLTNAPGPLLCIDQMKAFDRLSWDFMFRTLSELGFGTNFINFVYISYTDIFSMIKLKGYVSEPFSLHRGTRQGCPLKALLYVLRSELLAEATRD